ncbi:dipeptide ABC transporter ATP-binding protein [Steroidobacter flavus]|uniref:Dipeptide ABC transporter ATP-binding protein n=1 Tax=Steroidobacter flavus TaxID=1842136 RepID=A0ABV8SXU4_9GAMM
MSAAPTKLVDIRNLSVAAAGQHRPILDNISIDIEAAEVVAIVGESGSGKSTLARATIGLLPRGVQVSGGRIEVAGVEPSRLGESELRSMRGRMTGMVFQEPMSSLNPTMPVGMQLTEVCRTHLGMNRGEADDRAAAMLERVRIRDPRAALRRYPHEFSGGMRQRLMLAAALLHQPKLLIADEPTTALDVIVQREVLELMTELVREIGAALLLVTHDLAVVAAYAQRVAVLDSGRRVDWGPVADVILSPREPHVERLLAALPTGRRTDAATPADAAAPVLEIEQLCVTYPGQRRLPWLPRVDRVALQSVTLNVGAGETLAVVGESGSGKSSLARVLVRLLRPASGCVKFTGRDIAQLTGAALREARRELQIVFQDPASALDPRMTLFEIVAEGFPPSVSRERGEARRRVADLLLEVGLEERFLDVFPHQLSGGQRQRVCIARALAPQPRVLVADEAVSALDLSVQSRILALIESLQRKHGFACIFVTHNLAVAERIADRVAVLYRGELVECGTTAEVLDQPAHPYTRALLAASLELGPVAPGKYGLRARS